MRCDVSNVPPTGSDMNDTLSIPPPPADLLRGGALFLDFDGTLVDLAPTPDGVAVDDQLRALLAKLAGRLEGRIAIVSGRSIDDIQRMFGVTDFAISGSHGAEVRWPDGRGSAPQPPEWLAEARERMEALARGREGVIVETKPFGAALHYRLSPDAEEACRTLCLALAAKPDVQLQRGKMMFEVRVAGCDKGSAVRGMMNDPALAGARPVFIGDDVTDEDAFEAVAALGGAGILVGPERPTAAHYRLDSVAATRAWLGHVAGASA